jgi:hypothetical protein
MGYFPPTFPASWTRLRDQGRLQFSRLQRSGLWYAIIPELGEEKYARERHELGLWIDARIARLPQAAQPQPVNGHDHEPLPAHRNLLPRR